MKKPIPPRVKECVAKAVEVVLEEKKEVNIHMIIEILQNEYNIRFFNMEILEQLIKEALNDIVFIYC
ncbi:hypothetical protein [Clostridium beijerinckii]|uniref:tRNA(Ile2) C34 agmatinyltransferase TiaS n=1 Tax=Clostridium beijerinckii TaxID=1520 RepID=A0AAE5H8N1_CLOBE|nr:hypothetical protein [Clostridium beijerinckii]NSB16490.1 tRNA(Ile2) C34 agmatinyltransferase TiaS [Clostridium beijerinckii]OOM25695.1 hypothetical protein CLOBE_34900 [Clostridium beijerinckii]